MDSCEKKNVFISMWKRSPKGGGPCLRTEIANLEND